MVRKIHLIIAENILKLQRSKLEIKMRKHCKYGMIYHVFAEWITFLFIVTACCNVEKELKLSSAIFRSLLFQWNSVVCFCDKLEQFQIVIQCWLNPFKFSCRSKYKHRKEPCVVCSKWLTSFDIFLSLQFATTITVMTRL